MSSIWLENRQGDILQIIVLLFRNAFESHIPGKIITGVSRYLMLAVKHLAVAPYLEILQSISLSCDYSCKLHPPAGSISDKGRWWHC